jgi:RNA polymerase sigma factor (sigma-70 family)
VSPGLVNGVTAVMGTRRSGELFGHLETLFQAGAIGGLSDAQLLERFVAGRDEAGGANFRALVARHGPMVLRVCRSILHDPNEAEDAFQVTFLALARKAGSIRKHSSIASWLHGTAHRVAKKAKTAARRRLARESQVARATESDVSGEGQPSIEDRELSPILHEEIERLPAKYRVPIVLCYLEGRTQDQAAVELGWPAGTVRGRLARARDLLKSRLTRRGLVVSAGLAASASPADAASRAMSAALVEATVQAVLGRSVVGRLSRAAVLLLRAVLRDMALARWVRLAAPLVLIALVATGAASFLYQRGTKLSLERAATTKPRLVPRPVPTDLASDPLPDGALFRIGTTRFLHATHVQHIVFSPDGASLASYDGAVHLWDPLTGRERRRIETGPGRGNGSVQLAYAPDGRSLAVQAGETGEEAIPGRGRPHSYWTSLYDPRTGREIRRLEERGQQHGQSGANCLAFSPDGKMLAGGITGGEKPGIIVWEVASGRVLRSIADLCFGTMALAFSPDGTNLISCVSLVRDAPRQRRPHVAGQRLLPEESSIQLWDIATGKEIRRIGLGKAEITRAVLTPGGKTLATGMSDKTIRLWDLAALQEIRRFGQGDEVPYGIAFSPDGTKLASTAALGADFPAVGETLPLNGPIHVWDTATGREIRQWTTDNNSRVCFAPDGTTLATVEGQIIRLWDVASGREIRPQTGHRSAIEDATFTPDRESIMTLGHDRTIRFWDAMTGKEIRQFEAGDFGIRFAALSADGNTLATGGGFQPTRLWDVAAGRELRRFQMSGKIRDALVECADLSPDGKTLAAAVSNRLIFWDTATGEHRALVAESQIGQAIIEALQFAPDGKSLAMIYGDWVRIWDVASGKETRRITLPIEDRNDDFRTLGAKLVYSPDGTIVAATSRRDGVIYLIEVASGRELTRLDGPASRFKALAFSPDGKILATGVDISQGFPPDRELAIRLWDVAARKELSRVRAHRAEIGALAFSPDGRRLLSASWDATALVWDVAALAGRGKAGPPHSSSAKEGVSSVYR